MACQPWGSPACAAAQAVAGGTLDQLSRSITEAIAWVVTMSVSGWMTAPSMQSGQSLTLQRWVTPITALVATGGVMWQGLQMMISRKPEPLLVIVRGLWNVALWGAIGVVGTHLVLRATDGFSLWILSQAVHDVSGASISTRLRVLLVPAAALPSGLTLIVGVLVLIATFLQALLMLFRDAGTIILAGLLQLSAAGSFSQATSGWRPKVLGWALTLSTYKVAAALSYSVGLLIVGGRDNKEPRAFFVGVATLGISLVALPVLAKFFTWTVGSLQQGGGALWMFASAGAAGMHARASMRGHDGGLGGRGVNDHARYLETTFNRDATPAGTAAGTSTPPTFRAPPSGGPPGGAGGKGAAPVVGAVIDAGQKAASTARAAGNAAGGAMAGER